MSVFASLHSPNGTALTYEELGDDFASRNGQIGRPDEPVRIELTSQSSKAGNTYYAWDQNRVALPDGLGTRIRIMGEDIACGPVAVSSKGNEMVKGRGTVLVDGVKHSAQVTIVRTRTPFWIKVLVHRTGRSGA